MQHCTTALHALAWILMFSIVDTVLDRWGFSYVRQQSEVVLH